MVEAANPLAWGHQASTNHATHSGDSHLLIRGAPKNAFPEKLKWASMGDEIDSLSVNRFTLLAGCGRLVRPQPQLHQGVLRMTDDGSVSRWLGQLQAGDAAAVQPLWERYFHRLVDLARKKLRASPRRVADEEDVALSAFDSFCRNAGRGRFPQLLDRDGLWALLVAMTAHKAAHLQRDQARLKRGGGVQAAATNLEQVLSQEPSPEMAAEMAEEYRRLLEKLENRVLQEIALARMEGQTVDEIAAKLKCAPRSVKRKLQLIRTIWEGATDS
jgi:DNA-directed RNA polymerase specialized sigma24 family protein